MALDQLLHPTLDPARRATCCQGPAGSPGARRGAIVLDADTAETWRAAASR
jgi:hypothetical protein